MRLTRRDLGEGISFQVSSFYNNSFAVLELNNNARTSLETRTCCHGRRDSQRQKSSHKGW